MTIDIPPPLADHQFGHQLLFVWISRQIEPIEACVGPGQTVLNKQGGVEIGIWGRGGGRNGRRTSVPHRSMQNRLGPLEPRKLLKPSKGTLKMANRYYLCQFAVGMP
jgi:hypothetical protein